MDQLHPPETCYALVGDVNVAYQVLGRGPDLVVAPGFAGHVDLMWSEPQVERFIRRLGTSFRVILFDMPGTGVSDRVSRVATLDERVGIIAGVLDSVGSQRAALVGTSFGGQAAMLFAATHPERTSALILYSAFPRWWISEDELAAVLVEIGADVSRERIQKLAHHNSELVARLRSMFEHWGEGQILDLVSGPPHSELERRFWAVFERAAMSRAMALPTFQAILESDVTSVLPSIRVPTLVMHPTHDVATPVEFGRYLAAKIAGAKLIETAGAHHGFFFGDAAIAVAELERFLIGRTRSWDPDRAFGTIVFTDIVGSTERAAALGGERWRKLLMAHDALVRERVQARRGRAARRTGDGFLIIFERSIDAVRCAAEICAAAHKDLGVQIRAGVHSGEYELIGDDVAGLDVHIGARVSALAEPGEVLVSRAVKDLLARSGVEFTDRGAHTLKGVPGDWRLFAAHTDRLKPQQTRLLPTAYDRVSWGDRIAVSVAQRQPAIVRSVARAARQLPRPGLFTNPLLSRQIARKP